MYSATNFYRCGTKVRGGKPTEEEIQDGMGTTLVLNPLRRGRAANGIGTAKAEQTRKVEEVILFRPATRWMMGADCLQI
jgi:hypothetical protein